MPALSFSAVEILSALLNKSKTQTIRPLFCTADGKTHNPEYVHKPRLKVGDRVKLYWKMRNKAKWLCSNGHSVKNPPAFGGCNFTWDTCKGKIYPKLLGEVEIMEVFEIEMQAAGYGVSLWKTDGKAVDANEHLKWMAEIWKLDGFQKEEGFSGYFNEHYDLSTPKKFAVYRWRWL